MDYSFGYLPILAIEHIVSIAAACEHFTYASGLIHYKNMFFSGEVVVLSTREPYMVAVKVICQAGEQDLALHQVLRPIWHLIGLFVLYVHLTHFYTLMFITVAIIYALIGSCSSFPISIATIPVYLLIIVVSWFLLYLTVVAIHDLLQVVILFQLSLLLYLFTCSL